MKIGIFDSGIGGLSVLHRAMKMLPDAEFIYYADEEHVPYGEKEKDVIKGYVGEILDFMVERGVDGVLIACNTATSVSTKEFRAKYPVPVVGMEPALKRAIELYPDPDKRILVAATPVTIAGEKLRTLVERVDQDHRADLIALPKLVRFAENGIFDSPKIEEYLLDALKEFDLRDYAAVVLGCTHFNYFKKDFRKVFPKEIHFVDGNDGALRQLIRTTEEIKSEKSEQKISFYFSGRPVNEEERAKIDLYLAQLDKVYDIE